MLKFRLIKPHTRHKNYYLKRYLEIMTTAIPMVKWKPGGGRVYMDPFAGPGMCLVEGTDEQVLGSPLIALRTRGPFDRYYFGDLSDDNIQTLQIRISDEERSDLVVDYRTGRADESLEIWMSHEGPLVLFVVYLDPEGLEVPWRTMELLASMKHIDVILTLWDSAVTRNYERFRDRETSSFDDWFGSNAWKVVAKEKPTSKAASHAIMEAYVGNLRQLGFFVDLKDAPRITVSEMGVPLYWFLFMSKEKKAVELWHKARVIDHLGQRSMFDPGGS